MMMVILNLNLQIYNAYHNKIIKIDKYVQEMVVISKEQYMMVYIKHFIALNIVNNYAKFKVKDNFYKIIKMQYTDIHQQLEVNLLLEFKVLVKKTPH